MISGALQTKGFCFCLTPRYLLITDFGTMNDTKGKTQCIARLYIIMQHKGSFKERCHLDELYILYQNMCFHLVFDTRIKILDWQLPLYFLCVFITHIFCLVSSHFPSNCSTLCFLLSLYAICNASLPQDTSFSNESYAFF